MLIKKYKIPQNSFNFFKLNVKTEDIELHALKKDSRHLHL